MTDMLASYNLKQYISDPAHKSGHSLDWVISMGNDDIIKSSTVSSLLSDHRVILFELNLQKSTLLCHFSQL